MYTLIYFCLYSTSKFFDHAYHSVKQIFMSYDMSATVYSRRLESCLPFAPQI